MRVTAVFVIAAACGRSHFEVRDDAPIAPDALGAVGCADGEREAFVDRLRFPGIAGCTASWTAQRNMRLPRANVPCGDDLATCVSPTDACAIGWHICADNGDPSDLTARVSVAECANAGGAAGSYVAASSHCSGCINTCLAGEPECLYNLPLPCMTTFGQCAEPVCCGTTCTTSNNCRSGIFSSPGTMIVATTSACGANAATNQTGVLCCAD